MEKFLETIKKTKLFKGINDKEIMELVGSLKIKVKKYTKGEYLLNVGEIISWIGLVLEGSVFVIKEDFWGNRAILSEISKGEIFGEAYAASDSINVGVNVVASQYTEVLFLDIKKITDNKKNITDPKSILIKNLFSVLADKNIILTKKIQFMSQKTIKEKVMSYLSQCATEKRSSDFVIPFNRQELADYLSVDRSALSYVLCRLRDNGILTFNKNHFKLLGNKAKNTIKG